MYKINNMKMPECMLPDGAPACEAYQELYEHARLMEGRLESIRRLLSDLDIDCLGPATDGHEIWPLRDEVIDSITKLIDA